MRATLERHSVTTAEWPVTLPDGHVVVVHEDPVARLDGGYGLVAQAGPGEPDRDQVVGTVRWELLPNGDGELVLTVRPAWQGWLGWLLLNAIVKAAGERRVPNLELEVDPDDRVMLRLARARGCATVPTGEAGKVRMVLGTRGRLPTWPGPHDRPRVLVETPTGCWSGTAAARAAGLEVMICAGPGPGVPCPALEDRSCPLAATADAIVVSRPPDDDPSWTALLDAHPPLHPGVPLYLEPGETVAPVENVALAHARRSDGWLGDRSDG